MTARAEGFKGANPNSSVQEDGRPSRDCGMIVSDHSMGPSIGGRLFHDRPSVLQVFYSLCKQGKDHIY